VAFGHSHRPPTHNGLRPTRRGFLRREKTSARTEIKFFDLFDFSAPLHGVVRLVDEMISPIRRVNVKYPERLGLDAKLLRPGDLPFDFFRNGIDVEKLGTLDEQELAQFDGEASLLFQLA